MRLFRLRGGVHPPAHKAESGARPIETVVPAVGERLVIPMLQHAGPASRPVVQPGDTVAGGQTIGRADDDRGVDVHAPVSGRVVAVEERPIPHPSGLPGLCVVVEADGQARRVERVPLDWSTMDRAAVREALRERGVVGLGGAAFPSHRKLPGAGHGEIATLVINAAECEPHISCDDALMRACPADVVRGAVVLGELCGARDVVIGIEDNKPEAIAALVDACRGSGVQVRVVPARYPVGAARQLIYTVTGIAVPARDHATQHGVQCFNVATAVAVHRALDLGEPLIDRIVTVSGEVEQARNFRAPIGTLLGALLQRAGRRAGATRFLIGGPLMGHPLANLDAPVTKATNCLLAVAAVPQRRVMPCIRCGRCADACPVTLQPHDMYAMCRAGQFERARDYDVEACIECGACDYVCPSAIPLVAHFRHGKTEIAALAAREAGALRARERFAAHGERYERRAAEDETALARYEAQLREETSNGPALPDAVRLALERARGRSGT